jgi:hypothetical protein
VGPFLGHLLDRFLLLLSSSHFLFSFLRLLVLFSLYFFNLFLPVQLPLLPSLVLLPSSSPFIILTRESSLQDLKG